MPYTDTLSRIQQIQSQLAAVQTAFQPQAAPSTTAPATGTSSSSFANVLAQAQNAMQPGAAPDTGASLYPGAPLTGGTGVSSASLPTKAMSMLTSGQQQFASRLAADTGLDAGVISAWLLAEESDSAAQSRQAANNNDWLNIGYTDSGTYGAGAAIWNDPITAADATAGWLKGQDTIPGYGTASSGIQAILNSVSQGPGAQITAIQGSGWASGGYPALTQLYQQVTGA